jgi:nitrogen regulatory protein PII
MNYHGLFVIVERGKGKYIADEAKKAGAKGATIFYARGMGDLESQKLFNIQVDSSKEVIIIITEQQETQEILDAVVKAGKLEEPGAGIVFTVPVNNLIGLDYRNKLNQSSQH